jgi:hypothetical protein
MFSGFQRHWTPQQSPASGGVQPIARLHCKKRPGHWRLLLDNEDLFGAHIHEVSSIPDMVARVSATRESIGYETLWMLEKHRAHPVKILTVDGIAPSDQAALARGDYPLYRV